MLSGDEFQRVGHSLVGLATGYDFGPYQDPRFLMPAWNMTFFNQKNRSIPNGLELSLAKGAQVIPGVGYRGLGVDDSPPLAYMRDLGRENADIYQGGHKNLGIFSVAKYTLKQLGFNTDHIDVVSQFLVLQGRQPDQSRKAKNSISDVLDVAKRLNQTAYNMSVTDRQLFLQSIKKLLEGSQPHDDPEWKEIKTRLLQYYTADRIPYRKMPLQERHKQMVDARLRKEQEEHTIRHRMPWEPAPQKAVIEIMTPVDALSPLEIEQDFSEAVRSSKSQKTPKIMSQIIKSVARLEDLSAVLDRLVAYKDKLAHLSTNLDLISTPEECELLAKLVPHPLEKRLASRLESASVLDDLIIEASRVPHLKELLASQAYYLNFVDKLLELKDPLIQMNECFKTFLDEPCVKDLLNLLNRIIKGDGFKLNQRFVETTKSLKVDQDHTFYEYLQKLLSRHSPGLLNDLRRVGRQLYRSYSTMGELFEEIDQFTEQYQANKKYLAHIYTLSGFTHAAAVKLFRFYDKARPQVESILLIRSQIMNHYGKLVRFVEPPALHQLLDTLIPDYHLTDEAGDNPRATASSLRPKTEPPTANVAPATGDQQSPKDVPHVKKPLPPKPPPKAKAK